MMTPGYRWVVLLTGSSVFYMYYHPLHIFVPAIIIISTWYFGIQIDKSSSQGRRRRMFISSLIIVLGLLVFYKYIHFLLLTVLQILNLFKANTYSTDTYHSLSFFNDMLIPVGISYISFQSIGYLIEINRTSQTAEKHLGLFATYLLFFPKIFSGPIERAHHFLPQLHTIQAFNAEKAVTGLRRFTWGLFKKIVVAAHLQAFTDAVYNHPFQQTGLFLWLGAFLFLVQLYADFSGYTDMAIGLSQLLGFDLMENFNRPYLAKSTTELWRRWHISLSTWFYEYIFNPIALKHRDWKKGAIIYATFITFILLGFWHEAAWKFIVFGIIQATFLSLEFLTQKVRKRIRKRLPDLVNSIIGIIYVVAFMSFSLIFFRANNLKEAYYIVNKLFTGIKSSFVELVFHQQIPFYTEGKTGMLMALIGIILMILGDNFLSNPESIEKFNKKSVAARWLVYYLVLLLISWFGMFGSQPFIYYKF